MKTIVGEDGDIESDSDYYADSELSSDSIENSAPFIGKTKAKTKKKYTPKTDIKIPKPNGTIL